MKTFQSIVHCLLLGLFLAFLPTVVYGQSWPVSDLSHIFFQSENNKKIDSLVDKQIITVGKKFVVDLTLKDIYNLQNDAREALKDVKSVKDLKLSDISELLGLFLEVRTDLDWYVPSATDMAAFADIYEGVRNTDGAFSLMRELKAFSDPNVNPTSAAALANLLENLPAQSEAFEQMFAKKSFQVALSIVDEVPTLIERSTELAELVKKEDRFSMTEYERLRCLGYSSDYLLRALTNKEREVRLLQQGVRNYNQETIPKVEHAAQTRILEQLGNVELSNY